MEVMELLRSIIPYIVGAIIGYLAYNHKRHDKTEKNVLVLQTQMSAIIEDIKEIKDGVKELTKRH